MFAIPTNRNLLELPKPIGIATMFSGGGLADAGLKMLPNSELLWAIEYCPKIAEVYRTNHGDHLINKRVEDVDYSKLESPTILWASPECKEFSVAKKDGAEGEAQVVQGRAIATAISTLTPPIVLIENVRDYIGSKSWGIIQNQLEQSGYIFNATQVFNAANFGVPQSRKRLIIRAIHQSVYVHPYQRALFTPGNGTLPELNYCEPTIGWYQAVEDLIDTATPTTLANWQYKALSQWLAEHPIKLPVLVRSANSQQQWGKGYHEESDPAMTVMTNSPPKALLLQKVGARDGKIQVKEAEQQSFTIRALGGSRHWEQCTGLLVSGISDGFRKSELPSTTVTTSCGGKIAIAHIEDLLDIAQVVSVPPRWLARFQSVPDSYLLPEKKSLASVVIGNGVPCLLAYKIAALTLEDCQW